MMSNVICLSLPKWRCACLLFFMRPIHKHQGFHDQEGFHAMRSGTTFCFGCSGRPSDSTRGNITKTRASSLDPNKALTTWSRPGRADTATDKIDVDAVPGGAGAAPVITDLETAPAASLLDQLRRSVGRTLTGIALTAAKSPPTGKPPPKQNAKAEEKTTAHPLAAVQVDIPVANAAAPAATAIRRESSARLMAVAVDPTEGRAPTLNYEQKFPVLHWTRSQGQSGEELLANSQICQVSSNELRRHLKRYMTG